ncbi:DUF177 domain-containing protein [Alteribacillus sp. HJP-4]|uniref:YceD family protein n=1 Tax=Alteribacillus sp. HJP-4 TaxID=2775394 RepID=UPI0035CD1B15
MKWSIQQLLAKRHSGFTFEEEADVSELIDRDREIRDISPVHISGETEYTGETVTFTFQVSGSMILPCSRTLADVHYPFDIKAVERFQLDGGPVDEEDVQLHEPENGYVDLLPYVKENILLELPIQVFAKESDGKAQAPQVGRDWEVISEDKIKAEKEEANKEVDPRMADLAKFFDK